MTKFHNQTKELFGQTPWQTVGPFFHYAMSWRGGADLTGQSDAGARPDLLVPGHDHLPDREQSARQINGEAIVIKGLVLDGESNPIPDAIIESWQADEAGCYHTNPSLFGRCATAEDGSYVIHTIKPGPVTGDGSQIYAPHITLLIMARGVIKTLLTRLYFSNTPENTNDPVLQLVPQARRHTLMAEAESDHWHFDIHLQGEHETVFFTC